MLHRLTTLLTQLTKDDFYFLSQPFHLLFYRAFYLLPDQVF